MPGDIATMRHRFQQAARSAGATITSYPHPLPGPDGQALATDIAFLGRRDAAKLLITISGTHGVEAPFGSAAQTAFFARPAVRALPDDTALLAIHLINPWGTAWSRRVNEDNVDLNRNFIDWSTTPPENAAYADLHAALVASPDEDAATGSDYARLQPIIEAGQYAFPDGLFYGGNGAVWSNRTLHAILADYAGAARHIIAFDLHTGAGPYGYPAFWPWRR